MRNPDTLARLIKMIEDPEYLNNIHIRMREGRLSDALEKMIWAYVNGLPAQAVEVTGKDGGPVRIERVIVDVNPSNKS